MSLLVFHSAKMTVRAKRVALSVIKVMRRVAPVHSNELEIWSYDETKHPEDELAGSFQDALIQAKTANEIVYTLVTADAEEPVQHWRISHLSIWKRFA